MTNFRQTQVSGVASKPMTASRQLLIPPAVIRSQTSANDDNSTSSSSRRQANSSSSSRSMKPPMSRPRAKTTMTNSSSSKTGKQQQEPESEPEVWGSIEDLFWDHMEEVQNKWDTLKLNDDIWAKLIYFEQNRRLAKAYVSAPVLTIDGSTNGLDGFRIGLSGIDNTYRNLDSVGCLRSIGQGVKLKIDSQGNILIRKISQQNAGAFNSKCSVWIRDWPNSPPSSSSRATTNKPSMLTNANDIDENCTMREIEQSDTSYKLFDMRRFRHYLERRKMTDAGGAKLDWRQCVSIISFVRKQSDLKQQQQQQRPGNILEDPCWVMIINIIAIDMIKSIICDDRNPLISGQKSSSTLAHQHNLLNGHNNSSHKGTSLNLVKSQPSLRASSSTSVLYQPSLDPLSSGFTSGIIASNEAEGVARNRASKKARISNLRSTRQSSLARDTSHHCRYQSSLPQHQLSNSNIIYTTFNSKYINPPRVTSKNPRHACDLSTTSDYYSGSRGSSADYKTRPETSAYISASNSIQSQRAMGRPVNANNKGSAAPFARGDFVRQLEHNRSLSSFDLTTIQKPVQSAAIRMNYDHFSETEDLYEQDDEPSFPGTTTTSSRNNDSISEITGDKATQKQQQQQQHTNSIADKLSDGVDTSLFVSERHDESNKTSPSSNTGLVVDHNECQAMHNTATDAPNQKMSRSSLASSSSSSGCADNDYFMSHSSSSMSSSTASNERELLSQPASSSGIACSGNTSDEYDDNNRKSTINPQEEEQHTRTVLTELITTRLPPSHKHKVTEAPSSAVKDVDSKCVKSTTTKRLDTNGQTNHRRGYKIKTIAPPPRADQNFVDPQDCGVCDCEPQTVGYDCDCCCDCLIDDGSSLEPLNCCDCDTESLIYDCLPAPKSLAATRSGKSGNKLTRAVEESFNQMIKSKSDGNDVVVVTLDDSSSTAHSPATTTTSRTSDNSSERKGVNNHPGAKTSPGWLEKRKYSRILFPKFIFSSSNGSRRIGDDKSSTQRKSHTLDREEKFRLTRSTQDLS